jgi:hypothetical protein
LLWGGFVCIIASVIYALHLPKLRKFIRPVYIQKGIIPEPIH